MSKKTLQEVPSSADLSVSEQFPELPALQSDLAAISGTKSIRCHRYFTESARKAIVAQINSGALTTSAASREYGVSVTALYKWRYKYSDLKPNPIKLMDIKELVVERTTYEQRIKELEQLLGQKEVKIAFLEKALSIATTDSEVLKKK
jgi:transposase